LYSEFIRSTFSIAQQSEVAARFVTFTPAEKAQEFRELFPGPFQWFAQIDSADLGARIHHAIRHVQQAGCSHVLTIGTDSPSLPTDCLDQAATALETHDLVLGPAMDGGYYLIGLKNAPPSELFTGIDWSTERVLHQTLTRAEQLRMSVDLLPSWYDVDDLATLRRFCNENNLLPGLWQEVKPFLESMHDLTTQSLIDN
ncbi:MAG: TIGR04282 family arsenosugar biosynthesis glycosyltransferase, partial [bacterium]